MQIQPVHSGPLGTDVFSIIIPSIVENKNKQATRTDIELYSKESAKPGEI